MGTFKSHPRIGIAWITVILFFAPSAWAGVCPSFAALREFLPKRTSHDYSRYEKAAEFWQKELGGKFPFTVEQVLQKLKEKGDSSPETLMALMDLMAPGENSFSHLLKDLESQGIKVVFRRRRNREEVNTLQHRIKRRWGRVERLPGIGRKDYRLDIWLPENPPENATQLFERFYTLSAAMGALPLKEKDRRSPAMSFPVGKSSRSYPQQLVDAIRHGDERIYKTLQAWERHFGDTPLPLPEKSTRRWRGGLLSLPLSGLLKVIMPFYHPARKHRPTREGYIAYKEGPEAFQKFLNDRYRVRGTLKYGVDQWSRVYIGMHLYAMAYGTAKLIQAIRNGDIQAAFDISGRYLQGLADEEAMNEGLQEYQNNEEGDPLVNKYFQGLIQEIEKDITENGDGDGSKREKIAALKEEWNFLKN